MKHQIRLAQLEEICTKVAEGNITSEIIAKAFNLQTEKKQRLIKEQNEPKEPPAIQAARARVSRAKSSK